MSAARLEYDYTTTTGSWAWWPHIRYADDAGGALDAPRWILTGGMSARSGEHLGAAVLREATA